jgi:hypothetical protein
VVISCSHGSGDPGHVHVFENEFLEKLSFSLKPCPSVFTGCDSIKGGRRKNIEGGDTSQNCVRSSCFLHVHIDRCSHIHV